MTASPTPVTSPDFAGNLRRRVEALRAEIAAAQAKIPRTREAIRIRQQTLSRLEAQLALDGESRPARHGDE